MAESWQLLIVGVGLGIATQIGAYLLNNLSSVPPFPGQQKVLWRLTLWVVLLPILVAALLDEKMKGAAPPPALLATGAVGMGIAFDGSRLVQGWRGVKNDEEEESGTNDPWHKLLRESRRMVRQRLEDALGVSALPMNVGMVPDAGAVERRARLGDDERTVFLMPQQVLETFQDRQRRVLEWEETVLDTFDSEDIGGRLLILGVPGSGKTTTLLMLADELLARVEMTGKMPYIFELSSWRDEQEDLAQWVVGQLKFDYGIAAAESRQWLKDGKMVLLLDGLDELVTDRQRSCIEQINEFVTGPMACEVVVCCRTRIYEDNATALSGLRGALRVEPLTDEQIKKYLTARERVDIVNVIEARGVRNFFAVENRTEEQHGGQDDVQADEQEEKDRTEDAEILRIPLFLKILADVYESGMVLPNKSALLEAYVQRQLSPEVRREARKLARDREIQVDWAYATVKAEPENEVTLRYLRWLAYQLNENNLTNNFLIEQMQPTWISRKNRQLYLFASDFMDTLIYCLAIGTVIGLEFGLSGVLLVGTTLGVITGIMNGATSNLMSSVIGFPVSSIRLVEKISLSFSIRRLISVLFKSIILGITGGLFYGIVSGLLLDQMNNSNDGLKFGFLVCIIVGSIIAFISALTFTSDSEKPFRTIDQPNQGIISSGKNSFFLALFAYCSSLLLFYFLLPFFDSPITFRSSLILAAGIATFCGFVHGGSSILRHIILRFLLYWEGSIPWDYAQFLRHTTERRLTQQIGGRFRFLHRELLDYFDPSVD